MAKRGRPSKIKEKITDMENKETTPELDAFGNKASDNVEPTNEQMAETTPQPMKTDSGVVGDGTSGGFNPFGESVVERDYSTPKVAEGEVPDIGEQSFVPPSSYEQIAGQNAEQGEFENPFDNPNPAVNDLDNKDKKLACESMVDSVLDGYEQLCKFGAYKTKVDKDELLQKEIDGKISLHEQIPINENGDTMSVSDFIGSFNSQVDNALKYDASFGLKVRPAMVRVFMKKGWGMSDEQFLMYMWGRELATKVGIMYSLNGTMKSVLGALQKAYIRNKEEERPRQQRPHRAEPIREERFEDDDLEMELDDLENSTNEELFNTTEVSQQEFTDSQIIDDENSFGEKLDINMPERPTKKTHPKEIQKELNKESKEDNDNLKDPFDNE